MSLSDTPTAVVEELARELRALPSVVAADPLSGADARTDAPELDVVVQATDRGTLPNAVTWCIVRSSLGIAAVRDANAIGHKAVVVR
jgi:hypothetical protein